MAAITGPTPINDKSNEGQYWNALRNFDDTPPQEMVQLAKAANRSLQDVQRDLAILGSSATH